VGGGCERDGPKGGHLHVNVKTKKKAKKRRITNSTVTQTYGGFTSDELDTVADWGWRIFLWEGVVNGTSM